MKQVTQILDVNGHQVELVLKRIKNMYLRVYAPDGRVRLSAPYYLCQSELRRFIFSRLDWIRKQQESLQGRKGRKNADFIQYRDGDELWYQGCKLNLRIQKIASGRQYAELENGQLVLYIRPGTYRNKREALVANWYRRRLNAQLSHLVAKWQPILGVRVQEYKIRKMRSRWGSCNIAHKRIWLNLELARWSPACLEYVVLHEMVHLLERYHNKRFYRIMSHHLPGWRSYKAMLDSGSPEFSRDQNDFTMSV